MGVRGLSVLDRIHAKIEEIEAQITGRQVVMRKTKSFDVRETARAQIGVLVQSKNIWLARAADWTNDPPFND